MIETGKILQQRYRIDRQIGQGGMGAVYIATDERFGSTVAIKETLYMDDNYRKAIEREARLLNSLKHNALPRVSDHFEEEHRQFLVMEYIPGEDLGAMMDRDHKPFEVDQVLVWADQLLEALDFLHNQQVPVIHRDIKPQNLKTTSRGQIVLLDFGLAKGNPTDAGHQTAAKSIFGYSRNYASLEQIQGTGTDPRSDLYSLAATLYHLLTFTPPEDALTRAMSVLSNREDPLLPANAIRPEIPAGIAAILQQALDLNAAARPESAAGMRKMFADHEKYADMLNQLARVTAAVGDITTQKTRLMQDGTRQDAVRATDVKTAILPQYISEEETSIRQKAGTGKPARKPAFFRNAAAAILILCGLAAGGAYLTNPNIFGSDAEQPAAVEIPNPEPPAAQNSTENEQASETANAQTANSETGPVRAVVPQNPDRTTAAPKNPKTSSKESNVSVGDVTVNGDTVHVGNMTIKNGRITIPDAFVDENGVFRKIPTPPRTPIKMPTAEQLRYMTPEERENLRLLIKKQILQQRQRPVPQPTP